SSRSEARRRSRTEAQVRSRATRRGAAAHHAGMTTTFRDRILAGETLFGSWAGLGSPLAAELVARAGYDWVLVDLEHGAGTEADLLAHLTAIEGTGATALVRPQSGERLRIGRALDLGATGVIIPRLDSTAEAKEAVTFLRYPPAGQRGVALLTRGARLGTVGHADVGSLNRDIVGVVQVESPGALRDAREMAAID